MLWFIPSMRFSGYFLRYFLELFQYFINHYHLSSQFLLLRIFHNNVILPRMMIKIGETLGKCFIFVILMHLWRFRSEISEIIFLRTGNWLIPFVFLWNFIKLIFYKDLIFLQITHFLKFIHHFCYLLLIAAITI